MRLCRHHGVGAAPVVTLVAVAALSLAASDRATACVLSTTGAATVLDGAVYRLNLSAVDTGDGLPTSWTINWGDGAIETFPGNPASATHVYRPAVPSTHTFGILASAVCGGKTYFQNDLVVASSRDDSLKWYSHDAATNQAVSRPPVTSGPDAGLDFPCDPIVGPDGNVYVGGWNSGNVVRYDTAGNSLGEFATGGSSACGMAFGPDGNLYVADKDLSTVRRYDGTSGAYLGDFVTANLGGLDQAEGLTFGPDGNLYVTDFRNPGGNAVFRYHGISGAFIDQFVATGSGGLGNPEDLVFGSNGDLYVASDRNHNVLRYDGADGTFLGEYVPAGSGGLRNAQGLAFGPDGNLYVGSWGTDEVLRYQGPSGVSPGAFIDVYVSAGLGGLNQTVYFDFIPEQQVTVVASVFDFSKPITIDRSRISDASCGPTLSDYPMLFSVTDPDLRHTSFGGAVTDLGGDDIIFRALDAATCGGAAPCTLDHEIERYVDTTGELVAWVRVPAVNTAMAGSDTVIAIHYGSGTGNITSPTENPIGVWDAGFKGVWHLEENVTDEATGGIHDDSTSNANAGTQNDNGPIAGRIAGAQDFDANADYIDIGSSAGDIDVSRGSMSAWIQMNPMTGRGRVVHAFADAANEVFMGWEESVGGFRFAYDANGGNVLVTDAAATDTDGLEHLVTMTWDTTADEMKAFIDGTQVGTTKTGLGSWVGAILRVYVGASANDGLLEFDGMIDEVRISNTARTACWIGAEYENQSDPGDIGVPGFYMIGAATAVEVVAFTATGVDRSVELFWETGSELDNLGFHLYRSLSVEGPYERITPSPIPGLGSSPEGARYRYRDTGLTNGVTYYYELEDIETTGRTERHGPVAATPAVGAVPGHEEEPPEDDGSTPVITYGEPEANRLRVMKRGRHQVVLELTTAGFLAYPEPDGSVRIEIADYLGVDAYGLPTKAKWVEALAGRRVELVSVRERDVETTGLRPAGASEQEVVASGDGVVELKERGRRSGKRGEASTSDAARVVDVAFQGEVKKARVEMAPLSWDASRQELRLSKKLVVTLSFAKSDRAERVGRDGRRGKRSRLKDQPRQAGVVARLATRAPGLYAVRYEELFGAHAPRGVDAAQLRLSRLGEAVAFHLEPPTSHSRFAPGSTLYFVSPGAEANPYGDEAVFELAYGASGGAVMPVRDAAPSGAVARTYLRRDAYEENRLYQANLRETEERWMWDILFAPVTKGYPFVVDALASGAQPSRLELWLQGGTDFPESPDHHVAVYVNGTRVAERSWNGKLAQELDVELWPGVLRQGENLLEVENLGDTGARYSMVYMDRYAITYPRLALAEDGRLEGKWMASGTAEISGMSSTSALVDTTGAQPVWLTGAASSRNGFLRFRADAEHSYLVVDTRRMESPEIRRASASTPHWTSGSNRADYLVLGPRAFLDAAEPLLEHRSRQGLATVGVPVEEIYDELGFGESRPEAIRDFLTYAYHHWTAPSPRYVLLLGDATYDFKNYHGTGIENRVPPMMLETSFLWTVSDPTYAAVNGEDLLPDLAIGRLPAASIDEVRTMVGKILQYETGEASLQGRVVLVSDDPDPAGNFHADAEALAATVLAGGATSHLSLRDSGTAATRRAVRDAFDGGASLLSYIGHGGIHLWANENLLDVSSVASLSPQSQQPLLLTMNCLNGYFHFPFFNSLSEELVKTEAKGAIAAFSPSGMSLNGPANLYHEALLNALVHGEHTRLGDAVLGAQEAYAETGAFPELLSIYHLLGDPALALR